MFAGRVRRHRANPQLTCGEYALIGDGYQMQSPRPMATTLGTLGQIECDGPNCRGDANEVRRQIADQAKSLGRGSHNAIPPKSPTPVKGRRQRPRPGWSPGTAATRMLWNEDPSTTEPKRVPASRYRRYQPLVRIAVNRRTREFVQTEWTLGTIGEQCPAYCQHMRFDSH